MKIVRWLGLLKVFPFRLNYRDCKHILNAALPFWFIGAHQSMVVFSSANFYFPQPLPHSSFVVQIDPHGRKVIYIFNEQYSLSRHGISICFIVVVDLSMKILIFIWGKTS